eukprot:gb/GECH01012139.1/.p1 GENE.gb/GECH01012139.1/~~gb/GECH01012139.1/.p1  ORF type:complete len:497 (+),score=106.36 gb/GECH01012139.1/:1-1491(+)
MKYTTADLETPQLKNADKKMYESLERLSEGVLNEENRHAFEKEMESFHHLFQRFLSQKEKKRALEWSKIRVPGSDLLAEYDQLASPPESRVRDLLSKLVVVKLSGGLGTTMGCTGPKGLIELRGESSFLDMTVQQLQHLYDQYGVRIPLVLMASFNTERDTADVLEKYAHYDVPVHMFRQKQFPRIDRDTLTPIVRSADPAVMDKSEWYPPGHGDVYDSLYRSELYDQLRADGKEYVFISNIDNLGATVDVSILEYIAQQQLQFCMEVTNKTRADVKGGMPIEYDGHVTLLETAQVPPEHMEDFKSIKKFKIFNTNNVWVRLDAIAEHLEGLNTLDIITNVKSHRGRPVIQLETAAGAAIGQFKHSKGIRVPRSRFLPVKSTSDLLVVQSNLYDVEHGKLVMNPLRIERAGEPSVPLVKLGKEFKMVGDYQRRMPSIPNLLELDHLTVAGDVVFGSNVTLRGTVIIVANEGDHIDIPSNSVLENKVVTGSLRILDH